MFFRIKISVVCFYTLILTFGTGIAFAQESNYAVEWSVPEEIMPSHYWFNGHQANARIPVGYTPEGNVFIISWVKDGAIDTVGFFIEFSTDGSAFQGYLLKAANDSFLLGGLFDSLALNYSPGGGFRKVQQEKGHYAGCLKLNKANGLNFSFFDYSAAVIFDIPGGSLWGKCTSNKSTGSLLLSVLDEERVLTGYVFDPEPPLYINNLYANRDSLSLAMFNYLTDELIWSYSYQFLNIETSSGYYGIDADLLLDGDLSVLGSEFVEYRGAEPKNFQGFFFLRLNEAGEVVRSLRYTGGNGGQLEPWKQIISPQGDIYLFGTVKNDQAQGYSVNEKDFFLARLNSDYEVQWIRRIYVENFATFHGNFQLLDNGELAFGITTTGFFPTIYGRVSSDGELLSTIGYAIPVPVMNFDQTGAMAIHTSLKLDQNEGYIRTAIVSKTRSDGSLDSCFMLPNCVSLKNNLSMEMEEIEWARYPGVTSFGNITLSLDSMPSSTSPYCNDVYPTSAEFSVPDTICAGECLEVESVESYVANYLKWELQGPDGLDTSFAYQTNEPSDFSWCFEKPGHYYLSREIWVLGCADLYEREIVVLDDKEPLFPTEIVACQQPPYSLSANAPRPLTSYLWNNGSTAAELEVTSSGTYWLEASDGYCMLRDTVQLTFLDALLTQGPALSLPDDTAVCEQHLPYELLPQSPYTEDFSVLTISNSSASSFELWQAGSYEVQAEVYGCPVRDSFALEVNDCRSRIYFPTAFSPNGDGLNDLFLPQGKDYEGIELQVYDRWGGLLFSSQAPPFAWDGSDAAGGVYVYRFRYWNSLALQEEEISGQVVLLR